VLDGEAVRRLKYPLDGRNTIRLQSPVWTWSRIIIDVGVHLAALALGAAVVLLPGQGPLAFAYYTLARLGYVFYVSVSLRAQSQRLGLESRETAEARHQVFSRQVLRFQNVDGIAFVCLCIATWSTIPWRGWEWACITGGALLIGVGAGTKAWAVRCLGLGSYTWHDFFVPKENFVPCRTGPYRYLSDPMYTVGYLQTYGVALVCGSWHGLAGSLLAQASLLVVNEFVEKPHFRRLCAAVVEPAETAAK